VDFLRDLTISMLPIVVFDTTGTAGGILRLSNQAVSRG